MKSRCAVVLTLCCLSLTVFHHGTVLAGSSMCPSYLDLETTSKYVPECLSLGSRLTLEKRIELLEAAQHALWTNLDWDDLTRCFLGYVAQLAEDVIRKKYGEQVAGFDYPAEILEGDMSAELAAESKVPVKVRFRIYDGTGRKRELTREEVVHVQVSPAAWAARFCHPG